MLAESNRRAKSLKPQQLHEVRHECHVAPPADSEVRRLLLRPRTLDLDAHRRNERHHSGPPKEYHPSPSLAKTRRRGRRQLANQPGAKDSSRHHAEKEEASHKAKKSHNRIPNHSPKNIRRLI